MLLLGQNQKSSLNLAIRAAWFIQKPTCLLVLGCVLILGCQSRENSAPLPELTHQAYAPEDVWLTLEHDEGEVLSGVEATHTFDLTNEFSSTLRIVRDKDIVAN